MQRVYRRSGSRDHCDQCKHEGHWTTLKPEAFPSERHSPTAIIRHTKRSLADGGLLNSLSLKFRLEVSRGRWKYCQWLGWWLRWKAALFLFSYLYLWLALPLLLTHHSHHPSLIRLSLQASTLPFLQILPFRGWRWLGSRVVSVLDSGAEGPGSNRSRDAVW